MTNVTRRDLLKAGVAAASIIASPAFAEPEAGAQLRVLRWKQFVQGDIDLWTANTRKFTEMTGIKVRVDTESWEDIRPKAAVAAQVGTGPDIIIGTLDDPHKFPDALLDLSELATYLGSKYGGWYDPCVAYGMHDGRWIGLPQGAAGACINYRVSHVRAAGFEEIPKDTAGFLKLCEALKARGTPAGMALGHATGDANSWCHWLVWAHGGKMVDAKNNVVIDSPETVAALDYAKALYPTFIPGTRSWQDPSNNKAFLAGEISLTNNGISIYTVAKNSKDAGQQAIAADMNHTNFPIGPVGRPTEQHLLLQAYAFKYSKYPKAVQEYLRFMWEAEQYEPWQEASNGYVSPPLAKYTESPVWTRDPKVTPFRDVVKGMLPNGYA